MIAFLSPAKSLDFDSTLKIGEAQLPRFLSQAAEVNAVLEKKSVKSLRSLQSISENLAQLNKTRNQDWHIDHSPFNARQAALAFTGDVYQGLKANEWDTSDMAYAERHIHILSGLYGLLKPSDLIQPYRLEMGTKLSVKRKGDLYSFWKKHLLEFLKELDDSETILNLASKEYFRAVETAKPDNRIVSVEFKDYSKGTFKIISFFAKQARGMMANFIVKNRINKVEDLLAFNVAGYAYHAPTSTDNMLVFHREEKK
jgi:cytoplasmic iron level regulating protein YaaA (DUF328/UPF0246 family)